ncbi:MAG: hypothetical protein ACYDCQ_07955 [Dehalococcoidia bacterium]
MKPEPIGQALRTPGHASFRMDAADAIGPAGSVAGTRIQILCPCGNEAQARAANAVLAALLREENVRRWGGLTCSAVAEPSVVGAFWNERERDWEIDRSVLVLIDAIGEPESECWTYAARLHDLVARIYDRHLQPQRRFWVTVHPVRIVDTGASSVFGKATA